MTAPISVDPSALATTGGTVAGDGDAISAAIGSLDSALSGAGAMFGHDAAGIVFAQSYTASGKALLDAAASAVNACRRVGFGVQVSAANYGHANSSSTVGGGTSPVTVPTAPAPFNAPSMPPPFGGGIAAPMGWALVEAFVGDVWPDGNPGELRAAAGAWRSFGAAVTGLAGQVTATAPGLGAQQIPEAGQMVQALGQIGGGLTDIASQAQALATAVDGFAATVDATQNAVRGLLHQLSPAGVLETIGGIFTGHNPIDEIKKVAHEIKTVLDNMKREADASSQLFSQGINMLDSATDSLETWANKEFTNASGQEVGGALSAAFNWEIDGSEGALKFVAETAQGISQLDPKRFAYDPSGAAKTWEGMLESTAVVTNPALLASKIAADPQGSLDTLKGVVDWKDVEAGHPGRAVGYNAAQVGSLLIPGVGEAAPAVEGAEVAGRAASVEERAVAGLSRDAVPGLVGARSASEGIAGQAGRVSGELDGVKVPESMTSGAASGASAPAGRPPVETAPSPDAPGGYAPTDTAPSHTPVAEPPATQPVSPSMADSSPPHAENSASPRAAEPGTPPVSSGETGSYESPPQVADSPSAVTPGASHGAFDQHGRAGDTRPVWSNHEHGPAGDASHDPNAAHAPSADADGHQAGWVDDGVGPDGRIKFSGHGSYGSVDGVTVIPEGSSVTVYAEHGSTITDGLGNLIETGGDTSRVYSHTYHAGESMPNYTLHPPDGLNIEGNPWTVDTSTRLGDLLQANMGEIDFAACLYDPGAPTNLVYDSHGIWDETQAQLTHVYESPEPSGSWDDDDVVDGEIESQDVGLQPYYDANQGLFNQAPNWDYGDIDLDEF